MKQVWTPAEEKSTIRGQPQKLNLQNILSNASGPVLTRGEAGPPAQGSTTSGQDSITFTFIFSSQVSFLRQVEDLKGVRLTC